MVELQRLLRRNVGEGLIALLAGLSLFGSLVNARFSLIDDWTLAWYSYASERFHMWELPSLLVNYTEVGQFGTGTRFRPVYYTWVMVQVLLFGNNPSFYAYVRILLYSSVVFFTLVAIRDYVNILTSRRSIARLAYVTAVIATMISIAVLPAWSPLLDRVGPTELVLAVGLAMFVRGMVSLLLTDRCTAASLYWLIGGLAVAAGAKETGLGCAIVGVGVLLFRAQQHALPKLHIRDKALMTAMGFVPASVLAHSGLVLLRGTGEHGQEQSLAAILRQLGGFSLSPYGLIGASLVAASYLLVTLRVDVRKPKIHRLVAGLFLVVAFERIFYGDYQFDNIMRYRFTTQYLVALIGIIVYVQIAEYVLSSRTLFRSIPFFLVLAFCMVFAVNNPLASAEERREYAASTVRSTQSVANKIEQVLTDTRSERFNSVILLSFQRGVDAEPLNAVATFLRTSGMTKAIYYWDLEPSDGTEWSDGTMKLMTQGSDRINAWEPAPDVEAVCISFAFSAVNEALPAQSDIEKYCRKFVRMDE